jgi:hypothetical protein
VSTNIANPGPTTGSQWRSLQSGADLLTISHTDIRSVCAVGRPCTFAIGVFGFTDADFTIAATSSAGQLRLIDGIAFHEDLAANQLRIRALYAVSSISPVLLFSLSPHTVLVRVAILFSQVRVLCAAHQ